MGHGTANECVRFGQVGTQALARTAKGLGRPRTLLASCHIIPELPGLLIRYHLLTNILGTQCSDLLLNNPRL